LVNFKTMKKIILPVFLFLSACTGVNNHTHEHDHSLDDESENTEIIHITGKQMKIIDLELVKPKLMTLKHTVKANGSLELPPDKRARLGAQYGGRVTAISVIPGDTVQKGESIITLEHPEYLKLQKDYMKAVSDLEYQEKNYQRKMALQSDSFSSQSAVDKSKVERDMALANLKVLESQLLMLDMNPKRVAKGEFSRQIDLKAPFDGYITKVETSIGTYVQPEQQLVEMVDIHHLHLDLNVFEKDIALIKVGQEVLFTVPNIPGETMHAKIYSIGKALEVAPQSVIIHAELRENYPNMLPGMYVQGRVVVHDEASNTLPEDALLYDNGLYYAYVLERSDTSTMDDHLAFRRVEVLTGYRDLGNVEVNIDRPDLIDAWFAGKGSFYLEAERKKHQGNMHDH
jgi:cobalt-zinc-cadmium efflux system membrane fusion protein